MPRPLPKVRIETTRYGSKAKVTLDGHDVHNLIGYSVNHEAGRIQQVTLTIQAEVEMVTAAPPAPAPRPAPGSES